MMRESRPYKRGGCPEEDTISSPGRSPLITMVFDYVDPRGGCGGRAKLSAQAANRAVDC